MAFLPDNIATGSIFSAKGIKESVNETIASCVVHCVSFRCSVNDIISGYRCLFYHGRVYAEKYVGGLNFRYSRADLY